MLAEIHDFGKIMISHAGIVLDTLVTLITLSMTV